MSDWEFIWEGIDVDRITTIPFIRDALKEAKKRGFIMEKKLNDIEFVLRNAPILPEEVPDRIMEVLKDK